MAIKWLTLNGNVNTLIKIGGCPIHGEPRQGVMELKNLWPILIAGFFGWILGILSYMVTMLAARQTKKRDTARLLLQEIQYNSGIIRKFAYIHEKIFSGQQLKYEKGNPIPIDFGHSNVIKQFSFSIFDATLERHVLFDRSLLDTLHRFYRLLRQAEQFREIAEKDTNKLTKASWNKDVFSTSKAAMDISHEKNLFKRLEKLAKYRPAKTTNCT